MKNQIMSLLSSENLAAPDVTRPLKYIGDGNMLDGLKNMCNFSYNEGMKSGVIVGGVAASCAFGTVYLGHKFVKRIQFEFLKRRKQKEMGKKIQKAFKMETDDSSYTVNSETNDKVISEEDI